MICNFSVKSKVFSNVMYEVKRIYMEKWNCMTSPDTKKVFCEPAKNAKNAITC